MNTDVGAFVDKIIADAEKKIRTDLVHISSKAKNDFINKASEAVRMYYLNYPKPPRIYERTNNLRDNVINENVSFTVLNGNGYDAFVEFSAEGMSDYIRGSKYVVVDNFMKGIHGKESIFVEKNPAINLMNEFQDNYKKILDKYFVELGYMVK